MICGEEASGAAGRTGGRSSEVGDDRVTTALSGGDGAAGAI